MNPLFQHEKIYQIEIFYETHLGERYAFGNIEIPQKGKITGDTTINIQKEIPNSGRKTNIKGKLSNIDDAIRLTLGFFGEFDIVQCALDRAKLLENQPINGNPYDKLHFRGKWYLLSGHENMGFHSTPILENDYRWKPAEIILIRTEKDVEPIKKEYHISTIFSYIKDFVFEKQKTSQ